MSTQGKRGDHSIDEAMTASQKQHNQLNFVVCEKDLLPWAVVDEGASREDGASGKTASDGAPAAASVLTAASSCSPSSSVERRL